MHDGRLLDIFIYNCSGGRTNGQEEGGGWYLPTIAGDKEGRRLGQGEDTWVKGRSQSVVWCGSGLLWQDWVTKPIELDQWIHIRSMGNGSPLEDSSRASEWGQFEKWRLLHSANGLPKIKCHGPASAPPEKNARICEFHMAAGASGHGGLEWEGTGCA